MRLSQQPCVLWHCDAHHVSEAMADRPAMEPPRKEAGSADLVVGAAGRVIVVELESWGQPGTWVGTVGADLEAGQTAVAPL